MLLKKGERFTALFAGFAEVETTFGLAAVATTETAAELGSASVSAATAGAATAGAATAGTAGGMGASSAARIEWRRQAKLATPSSVNATSPTIVKVTRRTNRRRRASVGMAACDGLRGFSPPPAPATAGNHSLEVLASVNCGEVMVLK
jgi:hypothetical protein